MNYIINPWWFYWFSMFENLGIMSIVMTVFGIVTTLIFVITYFCTFDSEYNKEINAMARKWMKGAGIFAAIMLLLSVAIPSQETMIYMQIAKVATEENLDAAVDTAKSVADYIADTIVEINQSNK